MRYLLCLMLLVGCGGGSAEGKPYESDTLFMRLTIVGDSFNYTDRDATWNIALAEWRRVVRDKVSLVLVTDPEEVYSGPALTLENFWNSSIGNYWIKQVPPVDDGIRWIALPALEGKLYGGMHYGRKLLGSWFFTNVEPGNAARNAFIFWHEFLHSFGVRDSCDRRPSIMCAADAMYYRDNADAMHLDAIQMRAVRRRLGLRAGKTLVIK